eukprot:jgi/Ulvmu1/10100/UM006_0050.1
MEHPKQPQWLQEMPEPVLINVLNFLDLSDHAALACTCRRLLQLVHRDTQTGAALVARCFPTHDPTCDSTRRREEARIRYVRFRDVLRVASSPLARLVSDCRSMQWACRAHLFRAIFQPCKPTQDPAAQLYCHQDLDPATCLPWPLEGREWRLSPDLCEPDLSYQGDGPPPPRYRSPAHMCDNTHSQPLQPTSQQSTQHAAQHKTATAAQYFAKPASAGAATAPPQAGNSSGPQQSAQPPAGRLSAQPAATVLQPLFCTSTPQGLILRFLLPRERRCIQLGHAWHFTLEALPTAASRPRSQRPAGRHHDPAQVSGEDKTSPGVSPAERPIHLLTQPACKKLPSALARMMHEHRTGLSIHTMPRNGPTEKVYVDFFMHYQHLLACMQPPDPLAEAGVSCDWVADRYLHHSSRAKRQPPPPQQLAPSGEEVHVSPAEAGGCDEGGGAEVGGPPEQPQVLGGSGVPGSRTEIDRDLVFVVPNSSSAEEGAGAGAAAEHAAAGDASAAGAGGGVWAGAAAPDDWDPTGVGAGEAAGMHRVEDARQCGRAARFQGNEGTEHRGPGRDGGGAAAASCGSGGGSTRPLPRQGCKADLDAAGRAHVLCQAGSGGSSDGAAQAGAGGWAGAGHSMPSTQQQGGCAVAGGGCRPGGGGRRIRTEASWRAEEAAASQRARGERMGKLERMSNEQASRAMAAYLRQQMWLGCYIEPPMVGGDVFVALTVYRLPMADGEERAGAVVAAPTLVAALLMAQGGRAFDMVRGSAWMGELSVPGLLEMGAAQAAAPSPLSAAAQVAPGRGEGAAGAVDAVLVHRSGRAILGRAAGELWRVDEAEGRDLAYAEVSIPFIFDDQVIDGPIRLGGLPHFTMNPRVNSLTLMMGEYDAEMLQL